MKQPWLWLYLSLLFAAVPAVKVVAQENASFLPFQPQDVVIGIRKIKIGFPVKFEFGTGWCLDPECSLVISNYHVAMLIGLPLAIGGQKVLQRQLATGPKDTGAIGVNWRQASIGPPLQYVPSRDIAIFKLERPLARTRKGMHGIALYPDQLQEGEDVKVYAFPEGGKLATFPGKFLRELGNGILEFDMQRSPNGQTLRPGISGGIIVNQQNQAVGLVSEVEKGDRILQAVPIWSLADFVKKVQPSIYATLFPQPVYRPYALTLLDANAKSQSIDNNVETSGGGINPRAILPNFYLDYALGEPVPPLASRGAGTIQRRVEEPIDVQLLRAKAQNMVDEMANFIAILTLQFGRGAITEATSQDELRVLGGHEVFRKWPDGKKEMSQLENPVPNQGVVIGAQWSELPKVVGTDPKLKIEQVEAREIDGRKMKVFRFEAAVEDDACEFRSITNYIVWQSTWVGAVKCHGEVWTDDNLNILRITEDDELPPQKTRWRNLHMAVIYGWLEEPAKEPQLIPTSIILRANFGDGKTNWCRGTFSNYRMFTSEVRLGPATDARE